MFRIGQPLTEFGCSFIIMHGHTGTNLAVLLDTKGYNYMEIGQFLGGGFLSIKELRPPLIHSLGGGKLPVSTSD